MTTRSSIFTAAVGWAFLVVGGGCSELIGAGSGSIWVDGSSAGPERIMFQGLGGSLVMNNIILGARTGTRFNVTFSNNIVAGAPTTHAGNGNNTACLDLLARANLVSTQLSAAGFRDAAAKDFHLLASSAAVDKGVTLTGVVDFDYDGAQRLPPYDYGAYVAAAGIPLVTPQPQVER
ncbi:choice-of-anchor Q domain-containing protein [Myxococcus faecalis]|uniref:choice-of-anchor Q domain-containing protein n=1 Tax=Myxococcus faecalis TaxID=3115646 RepID=UPI0038D029C1